MRYILRNEDGVATASSYIMFSSLFLVFFTAMYMGMDLVLIEGPSEVVMEDSFTDVGNMMSTTLTDVYLIAPENGYINTSYNIPSEIGRDSYLINANVANADQIIEIESMDSEVSVSVTISGIAGAMPIEGTATSSSQDHRIVYDSRT